MSYMDATAKRQMEDAVRRLAMEIAAIDLPSLLSSVTEELAAGQMEDAGHWARGGRERAERLQGLVEAAMPLWHYARRELLNQPPTEPPARKTTAGAS